MTQFLSKVRIFDPVNEYSALHCKVLRNLISGALATRTNDFLPKLGQALGDCPTPVNNFVDTLIVEELAQGKGKITPLGRAIMERVAIMEYTMKKLSEELGGGDPQEKVQALTNSIFLEGYVGNPSNKVPIGGDRQWLPSLTRYVPFSARNVTKELGEAFAHMICKENDGVLEKDQNGNYQLDMLKYAMITESYIESIGEYSEIGSYVEEFGQALEKVLRDSELFLHAGEDNEVDRLLDIPERKSALRHALLKLPPENDIKEAYEKEAESVWKAITIKEKAYTQNSIPSMDKKAINGGLENTLSGSLSQMTVIQNPTIKGKFKEAKNLVLEGNTNIAGISQSGLAENRPTTGRKAGSKHRRSLN